jgi:hypothetical protein
VRRLGTESRRAHGVGRDHKLVNRLTHPGAEKAPSPCGKYRGIGAVIHVGQGGIGSRRAPASPPKPGPGPNPRTVFAASGRARGRPVVRRPFRSKAPRAWSSRRWRGAGGAGSGTTRLAAADRFLAPAARSRHETDATY